MNCKTCGGSGLCNDGLEVSNNCLKCNGTGQEVAKVELTCIKCEFYNADDCGQSFCEIRWECVSGHDKCNLNHRQTQTKKAIKQHINTAVLAERDRIMAALPKEHLVRISTFAYNNNYTSVMETSEVKKIIGGQS